MKEVFLPFARKLGIFSLLLAVVILILYFLLPRNFFTPALPVLFFFFLLMTLAGYLVLVRATRQKFIRFLNYYLLSVIIKLVIFIGVLVLYLMFNKKDAVPFGLWFFILYVLFTLFEVSSLLAYSKTLHQ